MTLQLAQTMMPRGWSGAIKYEGINYWDYINTSSSFSISMYGSGTTTSFNFYNAYGSLGQLLNLRERLTAINLPKCSISPYDNFCYMGKLSSLIIDFSNTTSLPQSCFFLCSKLQGSYVFPNVTFIASAALGGVGASSGNVCTMAFPKLLSIDYRAFSVYTKISYANLACYLTGNNIPSVINGSSMKSNNWPDTTKIYVPASMYNAYITNSQWSTISSHIYSI